MEGFPRYDRYKDSGVEWLGKIPAHWKIRRNFGVFDERKEVNRPDMELMSVTIDRGVIKQNEITVKKDSSNEDKGKYKVVRQGDLAYNKMRMWQGAIGMSEHDGIVSPAYIVLSPRDKAYAKFFHYLFRTDSFIREANRYSYGLCDDMNSLRYEDFKTIYSPIPPKRSVFRIVDFLDKKTAEIDETIKKKQQLIELLKEQKAVLINQAVTKGLDPDVPMRDSGVGWVGKIPANWAVKKIKHFVRFQSGGTPNKDNPDFWNGDIPWASPKDMKERFLAGTIDQITNEALNKTTLRMLEPNCILIVVRGMILARKVPVALATAPMTINQDMKALIVSTSCCSPEFLLFSLEGINNNLSELLEESGHGTRTLPTDSLSNFLIPLPPINEQAEIISKIKQFDDDFRHAVQGVRKQLSALEELKQVIISNAVTGKIKI